MNDLHTLYGDRAHVLNIYTLEAHPIEGRPLKFSYDSEGNPIEQPTAYDERVAMAVKTIEEAALVLPVLVDEMDNSVYCSYGRMPNNALLIGMDGMVVLVQPWSDPMEMEQALLEYLETLP